MVKMLSSHTMEYNSAIKKEKLLVYRTTWMSLKGIMLSKNKPVSEGYRLYDYIYITVSKG